MASALHSTACVSLAIVCIFFSPTQAAHFEYKDPHTNETCVLLDIKYNITYKAIQDKKIVAVKALNSEAKGITVDGYCKEDFRLIYLYYPNKMAFFRISYQPMKYPVAMYRDTQFTPQDIFSNVKDTGSWGFNDPRPFYQTDDKDSFRCNREDKMDYIPYQSPKSDYDYEVEVTVFSIQTQGFNIHGHKYGPPEDC